MLLKVKCALWLLELALTALIFKSITCRSTKSKIVPLFYDIHACSDKPHQVLIENVTVIMDSWGANFVSGGVQFFKEMKIISKGHFDVSNATLNVDALKLAEPDMEKYIWPFEVQLYDEFGELIACLDATAEFKQVKRRT